MEDLKKREKIVVSMQKASDADIQTLIDIERSVPSTNTYSFILDEQTWRRELAENTVELLKVGSVVVGSVAYAEKSPGHIYISGIIVRPEYQSKGIATSAIKYVIEKHPDATRIDLVTHPDNPALKLYGSLGFKVERQMENYFGDGEPRLVLSRIKE
jgi:[ribosomal protein S18]-alanine N-acetyltransferase